MIELECLIKEKGEEIKSFLVIDSMIDRGSAGGIRISKDLTMEELTLLAKNMTSKFGFLGIPQGGAKAGIVYDSDAPLEKRRQLLYLFGKKISHFLKNKNYIPGPDIGTNSDDIELMIKASGGKKPKKILPSGRSQFYTALSVFTGIKKAIKHFEIPLKGLKAAIEGFGKVGSGLAKLLHENGAKIIAVSTSEGAIFNENGFDANHLINELKKNEIKAKIICAGANVPVAPEAIKILYSRSILYLPDFVTNCGGVLGTYFEVSGLPFKEVSKFIPDLIGSKIDEIILESQNKGIPPTNYAKELALKRFKILKERVEGKNLVGKMLRPNLIRYIRNFLLPIILGKMAKYYFKKY